MWTPDSIIERFLGLLQTVISEISGAKEVFYVFLEKFCFPRKVPM
jgi:hypothetical protein